MVSSPSRDEGGRSSSVGAEVRGRERERDRTPRRIALPFKKRIDVVDAIMAYRFNPHGTRGFLITQQIQTVRKELLTGVFLFWK